MAHISSIGAGLYTDLAIAHQGPLTTEEWRLMDSGPEFQSYFLTETAVTTAATVKTASDILGEFIRIKNVRSFPAIGTPANIVNVPAYGQATTSTIQGQSDAPSLEITLNYVPSEWALTGLGAWVGDGVDKLIRFTLLNAEPNHGTTNPTDWASTVAGLGTVQNTQYYWRGKVASLMVTPNLTDSNTATVVFTITGRFWGAYTI